MRLLGSNLAQLSRALADHHADELITRSVLGHDFLDELAVTQNRQSVGNLIDLIKEVGDEEDGDARVANLAHNLEQILHFVGIQ